MPARIGPGPGQGTADHCNFTRGAHYGGWSSPTKEHHRSCLPTRIHSSASSGRCWSSFFFVLWIWLLIVIFGDIFRSHDMGGFAKALWVIFVIILPFLGVLVYLIARGGSMHERAPSRPSSSRRHSTTT